MIKIQEAKQVGKLYHYTSIANLMRILDTDVLQPHGKKTGKNNKFNSFTRNRNFHARDDTQSVDTEARLVIDGDKLSNLFKVKPYSDTSMTDPAKIGIVYTSTWYNNLEAEERVMVDIPKIHKYIISVELNGAIFGGGIDTERCLERLQEYDDFFEDFEPEDLTPHLISEYIKDNFDEDCSVIESRE